MARIILTFFAIMVFTGSVCGAEISSPRLMYTQHYYIEGEFVDCEIMYEEVPSSEYDIIEPDEYIWGNKRYDVVHIMTMEA